MNIEDLRQLCLALPGTTEDVKWGHDLCFSVGKKMYCVVALEGQPTTVSFKVRDEEFAEMSVREGFIPAPYMARVRWVQAQGFHPLSDADWQHFIRQSYKLVKATLTKKVQQQWAKE